MIIKNEIKKVYFVADDFFSAPNFIGRYKNQLSWFRKKIREEEKEEVKGILNAFYTACMNSSLDENTKLEVQLLFLETLNFYAQQYQSEETYKNIIGVFESEIKDRLFTRFPVKANLIYGETLLMYYNVIKEQEPLFSFEKTECLIKAKSYLWKIYIQHIERKNLISDANLSHTLTLLSLSLTELSRWFEPLYYLNVAKYYLFNNPNVEYSRTLLLEAIKDKTCLSYNSLLILKIIDACLSACKIPTVLKEQKQQLKKIENECRSFIQDQKQSISFLRSHKQKATKAFNKYNLYKKFCIENQLYLNEHSFFCNCDKATRDDLQIKTHHPHTQIEWVKKFEALIDILASDYILARHNYYYSLSDISISSYHVKSIERNDSIDGVKNALLKNSFKTLYSLLDQIAHGIFEVMEINYEMILQENFPENLARPKIYFLNMWDSELGLFKNNHFAENYYLISLYSISRDLNKSDYAALSSFRKLRNAMEHKILHISNSNSKTKGNRYETICSKNELTEKTKILMMLTKSAIYSFTYLIRNQSKYKDPNHNLSAK